MQVLGNSQPVGENEVILGLGEACGSSADWNGLF